MIWYDIKAQLEIFQAVCKHTNITPFLICRVIWIGEGGGQINIVGREFLHSAQMHLLSEQECHPDAAITCTNFNVIPCMYLNNLPQTGTQVAYSPQSSNAPQLPLPLLSERPGLTLVFASDQALHTQQLFVRVDRSKTGFAETLGWRYPSIVEKFLSSICEDRILWNFRMEGDWTCRKV